jgi:hypothetical protein
MILSDLKAKGVLPSIDTGQKWTDNGPVPGGPE